MENPDSIERFRQIQQELQRVPRMWCIVAARAYSERRQKASPKREAAPLP